MVSKRHNATYRRHVRGVQRPINRVLYALDGTYVTCGEYHRSLIGALTMGTFFRNSARLVSAVGRIFAAARRGAVKVRPASWGRSVSGVLTRHSSRKANAVT